MGSKRFDRIYDFARHGVRIHLRCSNGHCDHTGVADAWQCWYYFRAHRWPDALEAGALVHFRCTRCGARAGRAQPTEHPVTVLGFFPEDDRGWKALARRLRG